MAATGRNYDRCLPLLSERTVQRHTAQISCSLVSAGLSPKRCDEWSGFGRRCTPHGCVAQELMELVRHGALGGRIGFCTGFLR